jgi:UDP-N-acetyl-D-galactosamine dehydrogenase
MNELSLIFNKMGIDTKSVLEAAATKWNFLNFKPGLVGGHCIGVDPYYLTYKAEEIGYHSQIILAGRRINDDMGRYVAENLAKNLIKADIPVKNARVAILGFTFKENCADVRNTKVIDIIKELAEYGIAPLVCDPAADAAEAWKLYGISLSDLAEIKDMDAVIIAVAHDEFTAFDKAKIGSFYKKKSVKKVFLDLKGLFARQDFASDDYLYWRL